MTQTSLTIHHLRARAVNVPLMPPVQTASGTVASAPLVLIDLETNAGITGSSYLFCYTPLALGPTAQLLANLAPLLVGEAVAPGLLEQKLQARFRLLGPQGLTGMAMAGIDMAAWDALAKAANMPLVQLLGGPARPIPAYCSLRSMERAALLQEAETMAATGFTALKLRLGLPHLDAELELVQAMRQQLGPGVALLADYNQTLSVPEAIRRIRALDELGLTWIEEPTRADDDAGHAAIARAVATPIQIGENWWGPHEMARSIAANASDFVMPDVMKIGGVSGWLRAAALAETQGLPLSSHLFPEFSAHLLAVTPTAHWLEFLDLAGPILAAPPTVQGGFLHPSTEPGAGLAWDESAVARFLVSD
ncbi:MAG: hypothetical protein MUD01_04485 [Chloroflexaceae bacterium]|nr:hypothetical protein [Chloroflexaceae bacterium]